MDLRWGLLLVGLVILVFIYAYSRYKQEIDSFFAAISEPRAPIAKAIETVVGVDPLVDFVRGGWLGENRPDRPW